MSQTVNDALLMQRIDRLEAAVASLTGQTSNSRAGGQPPKPTGLATATQPGVIAFTWDPVLASDLKYYVIQIAENEGMAGAFEATTTDPRYTYYGGTPGVEYFARVRTVNRSDVGSPWTAVTSSEIGLVNAELIDNDTNIPHYDFIQTSGFGLGLVDDGATATYGPLVIETTTADAFVVFVAVAIDCTVDCHFGTGAENNGCTIEWLRRTSGGTDAVMYSRTEDFKYENPDQGSSVARTTIGFSPPLDTPGAAGSYEYRIRMTISSPVGGNDLTIVPVVIRATAIVFN